MQWNFQNGNTHPSKSISSCKGSRVIAFHCICFGGRETRLIQPRSSKLYVWHVLPLHWNICLNKRWRRPPLKETFLMAFRSSSRIAVISFCFCATSLSTCSQRIQVVVFSSPLPGCPLHLRLLESQFKHTVQQLLPIGLSSSKKLPEESQTSETCVYNVYSIYIHPCIHLLRFVPFLHYITHMGEHFLAASMVMGPRHLRGVRVVVPL